MQNHFLYFLLATFLFFSCKNDDAPVVQKTLQSVIDEKCELTPFDEFSMDFYVDFFYQNLRKMFGQLSHLLPMIPFGIANRFG